MSSSTDVIPKLGGQSSAVRQPTDLVEGLGADTVFMMRGRFTTLSKWYSGIQCHRYRFKVRR